MTQPHAKSEQSGTLASAAAGDELSRRSVAIWFALILALAVGLMTAFGVVWWGSDDASYFCIAERLLVGESYDTPMHHQSRTTMVLPIAASIWLFGSTPIAVVLPTLLASLLTLVGVAVLGRLLWGWWEGLLAATIVAVIPYYLVLGTVAYPDVHVCLWSVLAMVLTLWVLRSDTGNAGTWRLLLVGVLVGMAGGAKIFGVLVGVAIAYAIAAAGGRTLTRRLGMLGLVIAGGGLAFVLRGLFFLWVADDFWYVIHGISNIRNGPGIWDEWIAKYDGNLATLISDRLLEPFHPAMSGWGWIGTVLMPASLIVLFCNRRGRVLVIWAWCVYLVVAFAPTSLSAPYRPQPIFHLRHVLPAAIPMALCLAWCVRWVVSNISGKRWATAAWPALYAVVVVIALCDRRAIQDILHRPTRDVATAVTRLVEEIDPAETSPIFVTPAFYMRFRIMFPEPIRDRLRVSASRHELAWWQGATYDIDSRLGIPQPGLRCSVIATPDQLRGKPEPWDYDVGLAPEALALWSGCRPSHSIVKYKDWSISQYDPQRVALRPLLLMIDNTVTLTSGVVERSTS